MANEKASPWGALKHSTFRWLWLASIASNIGTWMHEVGAGWLMTSLSANPMHVALVQVAGSAPMFLLALPAGAESIVAGLSQNRVSITADFDGSEILIYGAVKRDTPPPEGGPLEVIVTVEGSITTPL